MITNTIILNTDTGSVVYYKKYWKADIGHDEIEKFYQAYFDLQETLRKEPEVPITPEKSKFIYRRLDQYLVVFVASQNYDEKRIVNQLTKAINWLKDEGLDQRLDHLEEIDVKIITNKFDHLTLLPLKICLVGEGGVGKTSLLKLISKGDIQRVYVPTIALDIDQVEAVRFGNYAVMVWDLAGQDRFRSLWDMYLKGSDVVFLINDSSMKGVMASRNLLDKIKKSCPGILIWVIANKQDNNGSLNPELVEKILGHRTYPMVATDPSRRSDLINIILDAAMKFHNSTS